MLNGIEQVASHCGGCGGEKDAEGWCANYCEDGDSPNDRFCRHCGNEMASDEPISAYCRQCVESV